MESVLGSAWPLIANENIDFRDATIRRGVSLLIATMHLRNPAMQKVLEAMHTQIVSLFDGAPKRADGTPAVEAIRLKGRELKLDTSDWHKYKNWDANDHHRYFMDMIEKMTTEIATGFIAKRWSVICADQDVFITADKPVVLQHDTSASPGFSTPGALICFPLSPTRTLVLDDKLSEPDGQYHALQPSAGPAINLGVWLNTDRFLITGRNVGIVLN